MPLSLLSAPSKAFAWVADTAEHSMAVKYQSRKKYAWLAKQLHPATSTWRSAQQILVTTLIRSIQVTITDFKTQLHSLIQLQRTAHTKGRS
jgi:hypothetical protein